MRTLLQGPAVSLFQRFYCIPNTPETKMDMWQSRVEIKSYSVAYFECITMFEVRIAELPLR